MFGFHRPYFNWDPFDLAEYLIEEGRAPDACWDLVVFDPMGPQPAIQRASCVYQYASLTKDPTACELLLPSDYGWSCLGAARERGEPCSISYDRDVSWWINSPYDSPVKAIMDDCKSGSVTSDKGRKCCHVLRVTSEPGFDDCTIFESGSEFSDQCLSQLAMKKGHGEFCDAIADDNARIICELRVKYR